MAPAAALQAELIAFYRDTGRHGDPGVAPALDFASAQLRLCTEPAPRRPRTLPVTRLLADALTAVAEPCAALAGAIAAAAPAFHWRQNPNYTAPVMGDAFMAGYGYVEFAGPKDALFHAAAIRAGLLVLAAGLHYPPHAHPAEEVYHPLTGGARWRRDAEPWRQVPAGAAIHHPPMMPHETRAGSTTLLALYCWFGDTATEARLAG